MPKPESITVAEYLELQAKQKRARRRRAVAVEITPGGQVVEPGYVILEMSLPVSKNEEPAKIKARDLRKKEWQDHAIEAWMAAGMPRMKKAEVTLRYFFPGTNARDFDNYIGLAVKGIMDGLKRCILPEDNSRVVTRLSIEFEYEADRPRLEVHLRSVERI